MACELQDRKTEAAVAPEDTTTEWVSGEYELELLKGPKVDPPVGKRTKLPFDTPVAWQGFKGMSMTH